MNHAPTSFGRKISLSRGRDCGLFVAVHTTVFDAERLRKGETPALPLVGFIAIQAAGHDPATLVVLTLIDCRDPCQRRTGSDRAKADLKAVARANEAVRAIGH